MSFFKKLGLGSNAAQQKPSAETNPSTMQSMYNFEQPKEVIPEKSYEAESKPGKPPASKPAGKSSMFSNMKIKKIPQEQKKEETTTFSQNGSSTYVPPSLQSSHVDAYQPPVIAKREEKVPPSFVKHKQSSEVESSDRESVPVYVRPSNPPIKRKNSSNSAAEPQLPTQESPSKKSLKTENPGPTRSVAGNSQVRANSKSSLARRDEVPVRRNSEASRDQVKQIQNQMLRSKERLIEQMKAQKQIKNRIMDESESLVILKERQDESVQKQNAAVETENYDQAAQLEEEIAQLKEQISAAETALVGLQKCFAEAEEGICSEYLREQQEKAIFKKRLIRAKVEAEKAYDLVMKTQNEKIELQKSKMQRDRKKLSSFQTQISFNQQKINELNHQYEEDLNNQTRLFKDQKSQLSSRKLQIADDISDLENRLKQKREELQVVDSELELADSNIEEVKRGFQNQYRKIVQRKDKLYEMEMEKDQLQLGVQQLQTLTEDQVRSLESTLSQMKKSISFITEQSEEYTDDSRFKAKLQKRRSAFEMFLKETVKVKGFQGEMKGKQDRVKEIEFKKSSLSLEISLLDGKKKELKDRIPQLEKEKIALVSGKNFKGAQAKSTEIKEANDELTLLSSEVQSKYEQEKKLDKQYVDAQEILEAQKEVESNLKRDLARSQFELELLRFEDLNAEKLALSKYTSVQKEELLLFVDSEIQELKEELDFLKSEYGLAKEQESPVKQKPDQNQTSEQQKQQTIPENETHLQEKVESEPKQEQPSVEYQQFTQQQDNSKYGYISASPLEETPDAQQPQPQSKAEEAQTLNQNQNNSSQNPVSEQQNPSSDKGGNNENQKSEEESVEEVKNEGYQPANF